MLTSILSKIKENINNLFKNFLDKSKNMGKERNRDKEIININNIIQDFPLGSAITDLNGNFIKVNKTLCEIIGYIETEFYDRNFVNITYKEDVALELALTKKLIQKEIPNYIINKRYISKEGLIINTTCYVCSIKQNNEPKYFLTLVQVLNPTNLTIKSSFTEESEKEENTKEIIKKLKELNLAKDDFLNTVSHELRSPLTNIKMAISMLRVGREINKEKYLNILEKECDKELNLINDLLDIQRLESSYSEEVKEIIDLNDWVENFIQPYQSRAIQNNQKLLYSLNEVNCLVSINVKDFSRVLNELLNNACKYTDQDKIIQLEIILLKGILRIIVKNEADILPKELDKIFDKFYRIGGKNNTIGGSGLGLALVKSLVIFMKGDITATIENDFIVFTVNIPLS